MKRQGVSLPLEEGIFIVGFMLTLGSWIAMDFAPFAETGIIFSVGIVLMGIGAALGEKRWVNVVGVLLILIGVFLFIMSAGAAMNETTSAFLQAGFLGLSAEVRHD